MKNITDKKIMTMSEDRQTITLDSNTIEELSIKNVWNDMLHLEKQIRQTQAQINKMEKENAYEVARTQAKEQYDNAIKEIDKAEEEKKAETELDNIKIRLEMMNNYSNSAKECLVLEIDEYKTKLSLKINELKIENKYDRLDGKEKDKMRGKIIATALNDVEVSGLKVDDVNNPFVAELIAKEFN